MATPTTSNTTIEFKKCSNCTRDAQPLTEFQKNGKTYKTCVKCRNKGKLHDDKRREDSAFCEAKNKYCIETGASAKSRAKSRAADEAAYLAHNATTHREYMQRKREEAANSNEAT